MRTFLDVFYGARLRLIESAFSTRGEDLAHRLALGATGYDEPGYTARMDALDRTAEGNAFAYLAGGLAAMITHPIGTYRLLEGFIADRRYGSENDPLFNAGPIEELALSYDARRTVNLSIQGVPVEAERLERAQRITARFEANHHEPMPWARELGDAIAGSTAWMYLPGSYQARSQSVGPVRQESNETFGASTLIAHEPTRTHTAQKATPSGPDSQRTATTFAARMPRLIRR